MRFSFILINYNNAQITIDCVNSILKAKQDNNDQLRIIIVDNNSNDRDREYLKNWQKEHSTIDVLEVYYCEKNLGYFKAINRGLELLSYEDKQSYVAIGNNDLIYDIDFINVLKLKKYNTDIFVVAPNIVNINGLHQNPHVVNRISKFREFYYTIYNTNYYIAILLEYIASALNLRSSKKDKIDYESSRYITMGFGACYILLPAFFSHNKELDDFLFLMGEEAMLAHQVIRSGGRTYYDAQLKVHHIDNATFKLIPSKTTYKFNRESYIASKKYYKYSDIVDKKIG